MNLIEKLGLEKCQEIVDGAPDHTADHYAVGDWGIAYFSLEFCSVWCEEEKDWFDSDYTTVEELGCDYKSVISLKDLRAAIADHNRTDYVSDIKNHIAPTTKVIER